mmetsp:Transcript_96099/g.311784  ORF Transcript_96099/g.311784 Transcript_96099/m.311784 type:complete len:268 (+) Transcript_96099:340-1143(+)
MLRNGHHQHATATIRHLEIRGPRHRRSGRRSCAPCCPRGRAAEPASRCSVAGKSVAHHPLSAQTSKANPPYSALYKPGLKSKTVQTTMWPRPPPASASARLHRTASSPECIHCQLAPWPSQGWSSRPHQHIQKATAPEVQYRGAGMSRYQCATTAAWHVEAPRNLRADANPLLRESPSQPRTRGRPYRWPAAHPESAPPCGRSCERSPCGSCTTRRSAMPCPSCPRPRRVRGPRPPSGIPGHWPSRAGRRCSARPRRPRRRRSRARS